MPPSPWVLANKGKLGRRQRQSREGGESFPIVLTLCIIHRTRT